MKKIIALLLTFSPFVLAAQVKDSLEMSMQSAVSLESLLEGRFAGADMTAITGSRVGAVSTTLRGVNSLSASSQPLWIIDGAFVNPSDAEVPAPFWQYGNRIWAAPQNSFLGISAYDVESIEVVKDLSAAALYGSLGANGVVIVKTKSGEGRRIRAYADMDALTLSPAFNLSVSGNRERNRYYLSANYSGLGGNSSYGSTGGYRFNFDSNRNGALSLGMYSSGSIASFGDVSPKAEPDGDVDDDSAEYRITDSFWMELAAGYGLRFRADVGVDYRSKRRYIWYGNGTAFGVEKNGAASVSSMELFRLNASAGAWWSRWLGKEFLEMSVKADAVMDDVTSSVMNGFDFFDYGLRAKGISLAGSAAKLHRSDYSYSRSGALASVRYSHNGRFGADASVRVEGNDGFGETLVYPSANAYIDLRRLLPVLPDAFSSLRLTAGWGKAGLAAYVPYLGIEEYSQIYPVQADNDFQAFFRGRSLLSSTESNAGIEFGLFSGKVEVSVKYYDKNTRDLFTVYCSGYEFGENGYWKHGPQFKDFEQWGTVRNRGVESSVDAVLLRWKGIDWKAGLVFAYNAGTVRGVPYTSAAADAYSGRWAFTDAVGYAPGVIVGFDSENGVLKDHTGDGRVTDADRVVLGSTVPRFITGLSTSLAWRRFSLDAMLTGRSGASYIDFPALFAADESAGDIVPLSGQYVKSADMVRLSHVCISYDVPLSGVSSIANLIVRLSAAGPASPSGSLPFKETGSCMAGICLTL